MITDRIERDIVIAASPERVWEAVTQAEHLGAWFGDAGAEIDLRPGGRFVLHWKEHGTAYGRVETVEPHTTFAFRWVMTEGEQPTDRNSTLVVFTLAADGDRTRLNVVESGFASLDASAEQQAKRVEENTDGWRVKLDELRTHAESAAA